MQVGLFVFVISAGEFINPGDFIDPSILKEIEDSGFVKKLYGN